MAKKPTINHLNDGKIYGKAKLAKPKTSDASFLLKDFVETQPAGIYIPDVNGTFWGVANYDKLKKAPFYARILAFCSKKYKRRFLMLDQITTENETMKRTNSADVVTHRV